jgi:hypothetical protein
MFRRRDNVVGWRKTVMSNEQLKVGRWGEPQEDQVELALEPREPRRPEVADPVVTPGHARCVGCKRDLDPARMVLTDGELMCKTCIQNRQSTYAAPATAVRSASGLVTAIIGGAIGALVGGGIWAGIAIVTDLEVGYVAVLVGFLAGMGVRWGAGDRRSQGLQVLAAAFAIAGMLAAKYFVVAYVMVKIGHNEGLDIGMFHELIWRSFPTLLGEMLGPLDAVFAVLAVLAAARACKPE